MKVCEMNCSSALTIKTEKIIKHLEAERLALQEKMEQENKLSWMYCV